MGADFFRVSLESPVLFVNKATTDQNIIGSPLRTHLQTNGKYLIQENAVRTICTNKGTPKYYVKKNLKICPSKGAVSEAL